MPTPEEYQQMLEQTALGGQVSQQAQAAAAAQYYVEEKEKSIAEAQLEVEVTLTKLYHLLKQDSYKLVEEGGKMGWVPLADGKKRVLTDEGVERIMQTMNFYINKENLLSNFNEEQINRIMLTFRLALNANFFMKYNVIFRQPSFEECKEILKIRLQEQVDMKKYAIEVAGGIVDKATEEILAKGVLKELENKIDKEMRKIKEEKRKENLREWELVFEQLSQIVLATLNRAWKGEERGSLRRHTNISEVLGNSSPRSQEAGRFKWWGK